MHIQLTHITHFNMSKRILTIGVIAISFLLANQGLAHEMKTGGTASALIHINPNDRAITGKESEILFLISDKDKKFKLENCDCQAEIIFGTTTLLTQPLIASKTSYHGIFGPAIPFIFPHSGVYTIKLSASPKNEQDFEEFYISYNISVRDTLPQTSTAFKIVYSLIVILVLSASIIAFITLINKKEKA